MSLDRVATALEVCVPGCVARDASVAELTTYRVGGPVAVLVRVRDEAALASVASALREERAPVLIVGRGSNLLVADSGFAGVALVLTGEFEAIGVDIERGVVHAGAAVALPVLARRAAAAGLAGLEFFVGIPGSVGGAVRMNAGGHGRETREVLRTAWVVDRSVPGGAPEPRDAAGLEFGYRHSNIGPDEIVTRADFVATPDDIAACEARISEIVRWRREHQPGGSNAGSVFRNPPGDSAGRLIDAAGLKGLRVGGAVVSDKHANFFQAEPGATATDVAQLIAAVQARVEAASGVHLEPELHLVGFAHRDGVTTNNARSGS
jgi:UDP-N-acetylmuramate dehydrogenase